MGQNIFARLCHRLYQIVLRVSLPRLRAEVASSETISRYLLQSGNYTASTGRVKPRAFHPAPRDHKTSVFRVQGLEEWKIWKLGEIYVAQPLGKELRARADLLVANVTAVGLRVESKEPPPRHGNIIDWPAEKHEWMSRAQEVAAGATLRLRVPHSAD